MILFIDTECALRLEDIRSLELKYDLSFPIEYARHLLRHNGGRCDPNVFEFIENEQITQSNIDWFLAIYDGEYDNLEDYIVNYKINRSRIPKSFIPLAHDPGGNLICICNEDEKIYFWNHEKEFIGTTDAKASNICLIANSLQNLFSALK